MNRFEQVLFNGLLSTSENRQLNGFRYPSLDWLHTNLPKLSKISQKSGCSIALHVCGKETKNLLNNIEDNIALQLQPYVQRNELPATKARAYSCGFLFQRTLHN